MLGYGNSLSIPFTNLEDGVTSGDRAGDVLGRFRSCGHSDRLFGNLELALVVPHSVGTGLHCRGGEGTTRPSVGPVLSLVIEPSRIITICQSQQKGRVYPTNE